MTTATADTPVELLDRQHERLQAADGPQFVHELRRFYEFITAGPDAVVSALGELRAEATAVEERFAEHDRELALLWPYRGSFTWVPRPGFNDYELVLFADGLLNEFTRPKGSTAA